MLIYNAMSWSMCKVRWYQFKKIGISIFNCSIHKMDQEIKTLESQKLQCQRDFDVLKSEFLVRAKAGESNSSESQADAKHLSNLQAERDQLQREVDELNISLDQAIKERDRLLEDHSRNRSLAYQTRRKKKENLQTDKGSKPGSLHKPNSQPREKTSIKQIHEARAALKSLKRQIADTVDRI